MAINCELVFDGTCELVFNGRTNVNLSARTPITWRCILIHGSYQIIICLRNDYGWDPLDADMQRFAQPLAAALRTTCARTLLDRTGEPLKAVSYMDWRQTMG